jgi:hypothetical protein
VMLGDAAADEAEHRAGHDRAASCSSPYCHYLTVTTGIGSHKIIRAAETESTLGRRGGFVLSSAVQPLVSAARIQTVRANVGRPM